ncbi:MAG: D-alanyl-D-alanine carboxypeptidase, partial [Eubacterium sp.]|nr:D-alanyl-D-alanine carboxypeptidase [Eubacterium sp.]
GTYSIGIGAGVTYTFKDLLFMSLISSSADATDSLAVGVFGSKDACVKAMNEKCQELGLTGTHFDNPVGSDIGAGYKHTYATAKEMAIITRYAMSKPQIREAVRKKSYSPDARDITCTTTNWFLRGLQWYDEDKYKIIGTKSGTTNAAGNVFIATAMDNKGHEVICAYFGNVSKESTFSNIRKLFDYTFTKYKSGKLTLTPSNYDVRCSKSLGKVYDKYASLNVYPGEKDGKFYKNKAITRKELGRMMGGIDELKDRYTLKNFVSDNPRGTITASRLASLIQEIYPSHLSPDKVEEILGDSTNTENLTDQEKEAYAIFLQEGLYPGEAYKNASQILTRKDALLFADSFRQYQMKYNLTHFVKTPLSELPELEVEKSREAIEEEQEEDSTAVTVEETVTIKSVCPATTICNEEWMETLDDYHQKKELEREEAAAKKAEEKAAGENTAAEEATTGPETGTTTEVKK